MARQPFFNTNYQVASTAPAANLIAQSGAAQGQMFANLGKTIGSSIEKFRKNKEEKEKEKNAEDQFLRIYDEDPTNPIFQTFGVSNREEAAVAAKDISKDPALVNQAMSFYKGQVLMEDRKRVDAEREAGQRFAQRILGEVPQPRVDEIDQEIVGLEEKLFNISNRPKGSIPPPTGMIEKTIKRLEEEKRGLGKVPMFELEGKSFLDAYGKIGSPEEAGFVARQVAGLQARGDEREKQQFGNILNALNIGNITKGMKGDAFVSQFTPDTNYVFEESDANSMVSEAASAAGATLSTDQRDRARGKIRIVPLKELRSEASSTYKRLKLDEADSILNSYKDFQGFIAQGNPLSGDIAKEKLARMVQPVGLLTEDDLNRVGGSDGFMDRLNSALKKVKDGKVDPQTEQYLKEVVEVFGNRAAQVKREGTATALKSLSSQFDVTPDDIKAKTLFGTQLENIPSQLGDRSTQAPTFEKGSKIQGNFNGQTLEGTIKEIIGDEAIVELPDGSLVKVRRR